MDDRVTFLIFPKDKIYKEHFRLFFWGGWKNFIEEMLLMSVKKDGDWFGSWNDSLRKYHDQSLLFSRQERSIVNVVMYYSLEDPADFKD